MEKLVLFSLCSLVMILVVKKYHADYALLLSIIAGAGVMMFSMGYLSPVVSVISQYSSRVSSSFRLDMILRAISVAYLAQFASDTCRDAGESSLAVKIESAAKIMIASMSIPVMITLFENLMSMAGGL